MRFRVLAPLFIALLALTSCSTKKTVLPYFVDIQDQQGTLPASEYMSTIQPDDELQITLAGHNDCEIYQTDSHLRVDYICLQARSEFLLELLDCESIISTVVSAASVIASLVIALTVK